MRFPRLMKDKGCGTFREVKKFTWNRDKQSNLFNKILM